MGKHEIEQLLSLAIKAKQSGDIQAAQKQFAEILQASPFHAEASYQLGLIASDEKSYLKSAEYLQQAVYSSPKNTKYLSALGFSYQHSLAFDQAIKNYTKALEINPDDSIVLTKLGEIYQQLNQPEKAITVLNKAITSTPELVESQYQLAVLYHKTEQIDLALEHFYALSQKHHSDHLDTLIHKAIADIELKKNHYAEAFPSLCKAFDLTPSSRLANQIAHIALMFNLKDICLKICKRALELEPELPWAHYLIAQTYLLYKQPIKAKEHFKKTVNQDPYHINAHSRLGLLYELEENWDAARQCYLHGSRLNSNHLSANAYYIYQCMSTAHWDSSVNKILQLPKLISRHLSQPYTTICSKEIPISLIAEILPHESVSLNRLSDELANRNRLISDFHFQPKRSPGKKVNIAYCCSGNYQFLLHTIAPYHNKDRVNLTCYHLDCFNPSVDARFSEKLNHQILKTSQSDPNQTVWDKEKNLSKLAYEQAALEIYNDNIDILIDVSGDCMLSHPGLFCFKPAYMQCQWLGSLFPISQNLCDYQITAPSLIPSDSRSCFHERLLSLSQSLIAIKPMIPRGSPLPRSLLDIQQEQFVFACLQPIDHIEPEVFTVWMKILKVVPNSVLWLQTENPFALRQLKEEAIKGQVHSQRLIFTPIVRALDSSIDYRMYQLADLYLDTFYLNNTLQHLIPFALGKPVLTYMGDTPYGRFSAVLAKSAGQELMICRTKEEYLTKAIEYASSPNTLRSYEERIHKNQNNSTLFQIQNYVEDYENTLLTAYEKHAP